MKIAVFAALLGFAGGLTINATRAVSEHPASAEQVGSLGGVVTEKFERIERGIDAHDARESVRFEELKSICRNTSR